MKNWKSGTSTGQVGLVGLGHVVAIKHYYNQIEYAIRKVTQCIVQIGWQNNEYLHLAEKLLWLYTNSFTMYHVPSASIISLG